MPDIMHLIKVNASSERVYQALTTSEGIRNWWTREADLDSTIGGEGEFRFGSYGGTQVTKVKVAELVPSLRVRWRTTFSFRPEWTGTTITFDLRADTSGTEILFAHRGFQQADDIYALCTTGWGYYLVSLQQYLETGRGAPSPDIDFARVLGRESCV
jgi:uncharacterized protein YndB with AHSA1/START domain